MCFKIPPQVEFFAICGCKLGVSVSLFPLPCAFVVCYVSDKILIYKVFDGSKKKNKVFKIFSDALFSGNFSRVVVVYSEKRLFRLFLTKDISLEKVRVEIID